MRLLVSGSTSSLRAEMSLRPDRVGVLLTPGNGNREWWDAGVTWACDNECYGGLDAPKYLRMLGRVLAFKTRPAWVACPDVVGDAAATWARYLEWSPVLRSMGLPAAFVLQDGSEAMADAIFGDGGVAAVFVGGSTAWKLSEHAAGLTLEARGRGLPVHWGRVNTRRRIAYLAALMRQGRGWCDTFDGSGFSKFGKRIRMGVRWIDESLAQRQLLMFL